ncbi:bone morphogenetic protein 7-like [Trichosurus vulpecula]|uniref:bone morphogenetic protein 7-like n=1 Tax=Trichosurus vulpecula TaxID=9337 RepID=UPI00186B14E5|nr:bone morphogenetic protein 7-like [Trichosurus vulpecula]
MAIALLQKSLLLLLCCSGILSTLPRNWKLKMLIDEMEHLFTMEELDHKSGAPRTPPTFMTNLFRRVAHPSGISKTTGILMGNMVRSFEEKVHINHSHFFFNLSSVGKHEKVLRAELHVFKFRQSQHLLSEDKDKAIHYSRVEVHELLGSTPEAERGGLLKSRNLSLRSEGWLVFDVTQTVTDWVHGNLSDRSFLVLTTKNVGLPLNYDYHRTDRKWKNNENRNSLLVLFTQNEDPGPIRNGYMALPTMFRSDGEMNSSFLESLGLPESPPNLNISHDIRKPRSIVKNESIPKGCQKAPLYVDFEKIGWSKWVISPKGYQANYCRGKCLFPLGHGAEASNHACFLSFVVRFKLDPNVSRPSCVPRKLNSINLLYYDDANNVVLKQYKDMVADSCSCQ